MDGTDVESAAKEATEWASKALGYEQEVQVKSMPSEHSSEKWGWERRTPLAKHVEFPKERPPDLAHTIRDLLASPEASPVSLTFDLIIVGKDRDKLLSSSPANPGSEVIIPLSVPAMQETTIGALSPGQLTWALTRDLTRGYVLASDPLRVPALNELMNASTTARPRLV